MFRHSPMRNQRSRGIKVKKVLQVCVLLAVCFWLIYQVKRSHDKKKEFDKNDAMNSLNTRSDDEVIKFGRKDLHPKLEQTTKNIDKNDEEEAEEETVGEDEVNKNEDEDKEGKKIEEKEGNKIEEDDEENKHEEEEEKEEGDKIEENEEDKREEDDEKEEGDKIEENEEDGKIEEREGEEKEGGDDDIDEHDLEKSDVEVDREERSIKEEREEGDDKESEEKDNSVVDHGSEINTREAREEQYKADDASSAVTHDTQVITGSENVNATTENEIVEVITAQNTTTSSNGEDLEKADNGVSFNATVDAENGTSSFRTEFVDNSTEPILDFHELSVLQNGTESSLVSNEAQSATEGQNSSVEGSNTTNLVTTENLGEKYLNSSTDSDSVGSEPVVESQLYTEVEDGSGSSITEINNVKEGADESTISSKTEDADEVEKHNSNESSDSSVTQEEKEVLTDVDTLPEIRTEGSNTEYVAAE